MPFKISVPCGPTSSSCAVCASAERLAGSASGRSTNTLLCGSARTSTEVICENSGSLSARMMATTAYCCSSLCKTIKSVRRYASRLISRSVMASSVMGPEYGCTLTRRYGSGTRFFTACHCLVCVCIVLLLSTMKVCALCLQVAQVGRTGAQATELDEVFGIEEQLVHIPHLVDRDSLRPAQQVVKVLEGILRTVADVVEAQHAPRIAVNDGLLEAA